MKCEVKEKGFLDSTELNDFYEGGMLFPSCIKSSNVTSVGLLIILISQLRSGFKMCEN